MADHTYSFPHSDVYFDLHFKNVAADWMHITKV